MTLKRKLRIVYYTIIFAFVGVVMLRPAWIAEPLTAYVMGSFGLKKASPDKGTKK